MERVIDIMKSYYGDGATLEDVLNMKVDIEDDKFVEKMSEVLAYVYNDKMPFNKHIGIEVQSVSLDSVEVKVPMKDDLVGNYEQHILHGGVISAVIDLSGGIVAQLHALKNMKGLTIVEMRDKHAVIGTTNIRVDYLRPGRGDYFIFKSKMIRTGKKIAVIVTDVFNDKDQHIAMGTSSYLIG